MLVFALFYTENESGTEALPKRFEARFEDLTKRFEVLRSATKALTKRFEALPKGFEAALIAKFKLARASHIFHFFKSKSAY